MKTKLHSTFRILHSSFILHPSSFVLMAALTLCATAPTVPAQAFVNLDFEAAIIETNGQSGPAMWLDWNLAAPGWGHSAGDSTAVVYYLAEHLGLSQYFLLMDSVSPYYAPGTQLAGNYSLAFASGRLVDPDPESPWVNAFISQTGVIPAGAPTLHLLATGPFQVFLDDVEIGMTPRGGNAYAGDIAPFAGRMAELRVMNTATMPHTPTIVDNIAFIPEPSSAVVIAVSMALFWLRKRAGQAARGGRVDRANLEH